MRPDSQEPVKDSLALVALLLSCTVPHSSWWPLMEKDVARSKPDEPWRPVPALLDDCTERSLASCSESRCEDSAMNSARFTPECLLTPAYGSGAASGGSSLRTEEPSSVLLSVWLVESLCTSDLCAE